MQQNITKEMEELIQQFPEHHKLHCDILDSINKTISLINEVLKLEETGVENIDNTTLLLYDGFYNISKIFIEEKEENESSYEDAGGLG